MRRFRRRRGKRFGRREPATQDMALQITSMADIFTIILVFLLKSLSTGASPITPAAQMLLPEAVAGDQLTEAPQLEISSDGVLIDGKPVSRLEHFRFGSSDLEDNGTSRSLNLFLSGQASRLGRNPASQKPGQERRLLVLADRKTPYATVKTVLDTLAGNGYEQFKLVVVEDQSGESP